MDTLISGFVGLILEPDAATIRASYELAAAVLPANAEAALAPGSLPHVTLTQCALREAPGERVERCIARLEARLRGRSIPLRAVVPFPGGFVFWCVDEASPERPILQAAHEDALTLADGFLDPVANAAGVEGTRRLTGDDPVLVGNARTYGYAFVRERYLPHITLGFDPRLAVEGGSGPAFERLERPHALTVERIALARLGPYGRVACVTPGADPPAAARSSGRRRR